MPRLEDDRRVELLAQGLIERLAGEVDLDRVKTRLAAEMEVGASTLYRWLAGGSFGNARLPAAAVAPLATALGPELGADLVQAVIGEEFDAVPAETAGAVEGAACDMQSCARAMQEAADLISSIASATADGDVTPAERARIRKEATECIRWARVLQRACGNRR